MEKIRSLLRSLPIECYALLLPALSFLLIFVVTPELLPSRLSARFILTFIKNTFSGGLFSVVGIVLLIYFGAIAFRTMHSPRIKGGGKLDSGLSKGLWSQGISTLLLFSLYGFTLASLTLFLLMLFLTQNPLIVAKTSVFLLSTDRAMFSAYPPFVLHRFADIPLLEILLIGAYQSLAVAIPVAACLLSRRKRLFRAFFLSFLLAYMVSIPIWDHIPAIAPSFMFRDNVLQVPISEEIQSRVEEYPLSERLSAALDREKLIYDTHGLPMLFISTLPSMHAAWSFIIAFFLFELSLPLGLLGGGFAILNVLGAIYVEQHYAIDIIAGMFLAAAAIGGATWLLRIEPKYLREDRPLFPLLDRIEADISRLLNLFRRR